MFSAAITAKNPVAIAIVPAASPSILSKKLMEFIISITQNTDIPQLMYGELINSGLIKKIFTTDSIYTSENENIEIIRTFR